MSDEAENKVNSADERKRPKTVTGTVVSAKMQKTRTVTVMRLEPHPRYGKYVRRRTNYKVHDPQEVSGEGDVVRIVESRPLSKTKRWRLAEVVEKSRLPVGKAAAKAAGQQGGASS